MVTEMNINIQSITGTFFEKYSVLSHKGLKSTEEKIERQGKRDNQVAFFEKQKENLKNRECRTVEEIAEKMEPKTPEERLEELVEEATGTEDTGGMLEEIMEDAAQMQEEVQEAMQEELEEQLTTELSEELPYKSIDILI